MIHSASNAWSLQQFSEFAKSSKVQHPRVSHRLARPPACFRHWAPLCEIALSRYLGDHRETEGLRKSLLRCFDRLWRGHAGGRGIPNSCRIWRVQVWLSMRLKLPSRSLAVGVPRSLRSISIGCNRKNAAKPRALTVLPSCLQRPQEVPDHSGQVRHCRRRLETTGCSFRLRATTVQDRASTL